MDTLSAIRTGAKVEVYRGREIIATYDDAAQALADACRFTEAALAAVRAASPRRASRSPLAQVLAQ